MRRNSTSCHFVTSQIVASSALRPSSLRVTSDGSSECFDRTLDNSNTIRIFIAFPSRWLRDVPEGISSGTWGQQDPAGSRLASDSAHLPNFSHTTSPPSLISTGYYPDIIPTLQLQIINKSKKKSITILSRQRLLKMPHQNAIAVAAADKRARTSQIWDFPNRL
jgi:hypothetical protein